MCDWTDYFLPSVSGFEEGWALYAEFLGNELGLFSDPRDLLGYYSFNLLRASRLVVDTGVHYMGWSRKRMVDFIYENTSLSRKFSEIQADRYITWPGQATSYKLGELKFHELRAAQEKKKKADFDLKKFHTSLLSCIGALDSVEDCINAKKE